MVKNTLTTGPKLIENVQRTVLDAIEEGPPPSKPRGVS